MSSSRTGAVADLVAEAPLPRLRRWYIEVTKSHLSERCRGIQRPQTGRSRDGQALHVDELILPRGQTRARQELTLSRERALDTLVAGSRSLRRAPLCREPAPPSTSRVGARGGPRLIETVIVMIMRQVALAVVPGARGLLRPCEARGSASWTAIYHARRHRRRQPRACGEHLHGQMKETANIVKRATRRSLVVLDEDRTAGRTRPTASLSRGRWRSTCDVDRCRALFTSCTITS